ncbi:MAG: DUF2306 domain-containing protein [Polyangiaceae bacterium]|nr:DUF2306 domain-containing protein [Polyangiaceae bacterium]
MRVFAGILRGLFLAVMFAGSAAITAASLEYFDPDTLAPFIIERLPVVKFESLWLPALKVHVAAALVSFPLCLMLTMRWLQRRPRWHRYQGRLAGVLVLLGLVPSGAVLAFDAKGGAGVTAGFLLSGAIVAGCMAYGIRAARRRDMISHSRAMRHVIAQMSVAVTSRAMLIGFDEAGVNPDVAYVIALWVPVILSALVAEAVSRRFAFSFTQFIHALQRIYHGLSSFLVLRSRSTSGSIARSG